MSAATNALAAATKRADEIARSADYDRFLAFVRGLYPGTFDRPAANVERDYLRVVDQHLQKLLPYIQRHMASEIRRVIDFGCGSGGSAIALAMVYPHVTCVGTDIDEGAIKVARERAKLYGVADRCEFHHVAEGQPLSLREGSFDLSLCSSVLEYAVAPGVRRFCVQEMARLVKDGGLLFFSVPNRLYPFEIHTGKWGWNYFPSLLNARTVDTSWWEVRKLARPYALTLHRTPVVHLLRPWSAFCLRKEHSHGRTNGAARRASH